MRLGNEMLFNHQHTRRDEGEDQQEEQQEASVARARRDLLRAELCRGYNRRQFVLRAIVLAAQVLRISKAGLFKCSVLDVSERRKYKLPSFFHAKHDDTTQLSAHPHRMCIQQGRRCA